MECVPSTLHGCVKYLEEGIVHYVWMDEEPFNHCNMENLSDGPILSSIHIFFETIPLEHDSLSQGATINENFQNLKLESINDELVLNKIELNPLDECHKENILRIHQECHERMPIKPSPTIQEEISWKVKVNHLKIMLK